MKSVGRACVVLLLRWPPRHWCGHRYDGSRPPSLGRGRRTPARGPGSPSASRRPAPASRARRRVSDRQADRSSSCFLLPHGPQPSADLRQPPTHGALGDSEHVGGFCMGHLAIDRQRDGVSEVARQLTHRAPQPIQTRRCVCCRSSPVHFPIPPAACGPGPAGGPPTPVMRRVHGNPVEPGRHTGPSPKALQLCRQGQTDVLRQILRLLPPAGQPETEPEDPLVVKAQELRKGLTIASSGRPDQILLTSYGSRHDRHTRYDARDRSILGPLTTPS